jgi:hypothetical protein
MKLPRRWKNLKRHPLSAECPDLTEADAHRMFLGVRKHGVINDRKVTIHEGMILDGWQLYQACVQADVKPEAQPVPKGMTAEEYVELVNDTRRHETQEVVIARAVARRERVAEAKRAGKSNVEIASTEGVGESTIRNDLKVLRSQGANVDPPDGQIIDSKGRAQPATKAPRVIPQLQDLLDAGKITPKLAPDIEALDKNQQGVVFERIQAGVNVRKAIAGALAPTREPGEEGPTRRAAKNGQPVYDLKEYERVFGSLYRQVDRVREIHRLPETPQSEALARSLEDYDRSFRAWHAEVTKPAKAEG